MDQVIPPSVLIEQGLDNPAILAGGLFYAFTNKVLKRRHVSSFETFCIGVLYSKKGMPRPDKLTVEQSVLTSFQKLTTTPSIPVVLNFKGQEDRRYSRENLMFQISRTVLELFRDVRMSDDDRVEPYFPSTSATYSNTRHLGGAVGDILAHPEALKGLKTKNDLVKISVAFMKSSPTGSALIYDDRNLRLSYLQLYKNLVQIAYEQEASAILVGLAESLKVRTISKGPPPLYTLLKAFQVKMWSTLKVHPVFKLTGEPVTGRYVRSRMGSLRVGEAFLSVDYTDATNDLSSWCSEIAIREVCRELDLSIMETDLLHRALFQHVIEHNGVRLPQKRGQLMGSIVSFPILCIINAAICRHALELANQDSLFETLREQQEQGLPFTKSYDQIMKVSFKLSDCPLAINGDDAILRTTLFGYRHWQRLAAVCGLSESVGKVYFSPSFLNINSTTFNYVVSPEPDFLLRPYVNLGLLKGMKRSSSGSSTDVRDYSHSAICSDLIKRCPVDVRENALGSYIAFNHKFLLSHNIPLFIPVSQGGLGLPQVGKFKSRELDLRFLRKASDLGDRVTLPIFPSGKNWYCWDYARKRLPPGFMEALDAFPALGITEVDPYSGSRVTNLDHLLSLLTIEALFRIDGISDLYDPDMTHAKQAVKRYYRELSRYWKKVASFDTSLPPIGLDVNYEKPVKVGKMPLLYEYRQSLSMHSHSELFTTLPPLK
jgi:hypothetical protein